MKKVLFLFFEFFFKRFLIAVLGVVFYWASLGESLKGAWAGACCGRNAATPVLIVGEDHSQLGFGMSHAQKVAWADEEGEVALHPNDASETLRLVRMDAATLLSDRFQVGMTVPLATRMISIASESGSEMTTGWGDLRMSLGYEALPEWTYSSWIPQVFLFSTVTLPTARSIYDSQTLAGTDMLGNGYYSVSMGSLLVKRWNAWDFFLVPEAHYSFPREFELDGDRVLAQPGFGGSIALGGGWSPFEGPLRVGLRLQSRIDQSVVNRGLGSVYRGIDSGTAMVSYDSGIDLNYMFSSSDTITISYTDQTLLGIAVNSNLNRIVALSYQHRWER